MAKFSIIIPAAGAGKRFGGQVKKPFTQLDNRPLFIRAIELFVNRDDVCQVILAVSPDDYDVVREKYAANLMFMDIKLVKGGEERFASVRAALGEVTDEADYVAIHDAVRPCVLDTWIDKVFAEAEKSGAAILAAPLSGTIKRVSGAQVVDETLSRTGLFEAQTPQVFRKNLLRDAYDQLPDDTQPTDDAQVLEMAGAPVTVVATDARNIKITNPSDMVLASAILKSIERKAKPGPLNPFEEAQW